MKQPLAQLGVQRLQRRGAGAEVGLGQLVQRSSRSREVLVQIVGFRIDVQQASHDLAARLMH